MKYKLFRSPGDLDKVVRKHELVAVETGKSIDDVADALIRAVRDDLAEMPEYAHCETAAYVPEPVKSFRRVRRYRYEMMGIVYPKYAEENVRSIGICGATSTPKWLMEECKKAILNEK